ncbi:hypothetical protein CRG98_002788 [Punica granatum]|uniref:Uncharacterized protein n=1 Tax=Punica granatum TaxID=22663 RepID=A0A2I0L7X0_PUNGR|nr:hypothetical protein CRG98_002788 [Punica granatum]
MEQFYGEEMDPGVVVPRFDPMDVQEEDQAGSIDHHGLLDDGPMSFYASDFPPLPDFPCMSSSSSSSSTGAPVKATPSSSSSTASSSSTSAASWAVLRSDQDVDRSPPVQQSPAMLPAAATLTSALSSTASMDMILRDSKLEDTINCKEDEEAEVALEDCLDVMETFGYMDLLECNDLFDPTSMFQNEEPTDPTAGAYPVEEFQVQHQLPQEQPEQNFQRPEGADSHGPLTSAAQPYGEEQQPPAVVVKEGTDEMGQVLLEWLRTNRDSISAEDLRRVKIKKATIEAAARRLGGGKAAMKQLLKLILEWVQTNHLHRKRKEDEAQNKLHYPPLQDLPDPGTFPNPNPNMLNPSANSFTPELASCFPSQPQWAASPYMTDHSGPVMAAPPPFASSTVGYNMGGDPFSSSGDLYPGPPGLAEYHMLDSPQSWPLPQYGAMPNYNFMAADVNFQPPGAQAFIGYRNNSQYSNFPQQYYNSGNGERSLIRLGSSATKEARKKRMARQRRLMSHHHHRSINGHHNSHHANHQNGHHQAVMAMDHQQHARVGVCDQPGAAAANSGNWVYWPAAAPAVATPAPPPMMSPEAMQAHQPVERQPAMQGQSGQRGQVAPDRRPGWKPENNLKFLLQKVLKQSDVGNLGRIVLPKKEAETHLPELEARDGISISMEDIGTSRIWNMRYRFWPNNKSRMYLLENTDSKILAYWYDIAQLIRGVKVRQPEGEAKSNAKKPENSKPQRNSNLQGSYSTTANNASQRK